MNRSRLSAAFSVSPTLLRYFRGELIKAISFVMAAFVGLFAFFDLIAEVDRFSQPGTNVGYFFLSVLLGLPARVYEVAPIAALIGSIYALVQLAANSELTAMRAARLGTLGMLGILVRIAALVVVVTVVFGEAVAPAAEKAAVVMRAKALGTEVNRDFRSGYWLRDTVQDTQAGTRVRFVNFQAFDRSGELQTLEYFELDTEYRVRAWVRAARADFNPGNSSWTLHDVLVQRYFESPVGNPAAAQAGLDAHASPIERLDSMVWETNLAPGLLTGLFVRPDRMSAWQLYNYGSFLRSNLLASDNIDLAFAKKLVYPFAILIMMLISLPFAYTNFRSGGVSVKVFAGVMIGVGFHLVNNLFSHLSMVAKMPPFISASLPSLLGLVVGMAALWWVTHPAPLRSVIKLKF